MSKIPGLKGQEAASTRRLAAAVERGQPRSALLRAAARAGLAGTARDVLTYGVVLPATGKRRARFKAHESEKSERIARVIALAEILWDEQTTAQEFLRTPHPERGQWTPLERTNGVLSSRRVEDVVRLAVHRLPV